MSDTGATSSVHTPIQQAQLRLTRAKGHLAGARLAGRPAVEISDCAQRVVAAQAELEKLKLAAQEPPRKGRPAKP